MNHRQITVRKGAANGGNNISLWHISRQLPSFIVPGPGNIPKKKSREARYSSIWGCKNFTITPSEKRTKWKRSYEICIWSFWPRAQVRGQGRVPVVERCPVSVPVCGNFIKVQVNMLIPTLRWSHWGFPARGGSKQKKTTSAERKTLPAAAAEKLPATKVNKCPAKMAKKQKKKRKRKERVYAYVYERKENLSR